MSNNYFCKQCDYFTKVKCNYLKHINSKKCKERLGKKIVYECKKCDQGFKSDNKNDYQRHIDSFRCRTGGTRSDLHKLNKAYDIMKEWQIRRKDCNGSCQFCGQSLNRTCNSICKAARIDLAKNLKLFPDNNQWFMYDTHLKILCQKTIKTINISKLVARWWSNV